MIGGTGRGKFPGDMKTEGRVAVIGDIHGRLDALDAALAAIDDPARTELILLGDYIDRGPDSRGVLERLKEVEASGGFRNVVLLPGNHDGMLWAGVEKGDNGAAECWLMNGGIQLVMSEYPGWEMEAAFQDIAGSLPLQVQKRIDGELPAWHRSGDLLFVHAGIRPDANTEHFISLPYIQPKRSGDEDESWAWIRNRFLNHPGPQIGPDGREVIVVHGHTRILCADVRDLIAASAATLSQGRICLDCSGTDGALLLEAEGCEFSIKFCTPEPQPTAELSGDGPR
ncbi:metallophosphoesterase [Paracoccus sp. ME4]|uniref:metallophosphoesterase n=1 Tax=Paracoccus sp. ME4 TaxID=3138066 RepID=UPI00398AE430